MVRGGSWTTSPAYAEAAVRDDLYSDRTNDHVGIRLVMDAD